MATSFIHPSVSSTITDNSIVYVTSTGTTKLFAVFTSERGIDNKIQLITSVSEFEFWYGEPNMRAYGQVLYNVVNWLTSNGGAYCLRVLPEDAGYANAIINIQTKVSDQYVKDINGNLVLVPEVSLRPTILYTNVNNTSVETLSLNEVDRQGSETIDGYVNHPIIAVIPKGRGKGYNDLGFKIDVNDDFDSTYDFRLYNFTVTQVSDSGTLNVVQGPFLVSFDPDAMSLAGETLFIGDVLSRYCDYFDVIFSEDNYAALGESVNPYVNPNKIDFITGQSRMINDEPETFFCELTQQEEDINIFMQKHDINGNATGELNIADPSNEVTAAIVEVDNTLRNKNYLDAEVTVETMKEALSAIRKNDGSYAARIERYLSDTLTDRDILLVVNNELHEASNGIDSIAQTTTLEGTELADNAAIEGVTNNREYVNHYTSKAKDAIENALKVFPEMYNWVAIAGTSSESVAYVEDMQDANGKYDAIDTINIQLSSLNSVINNLKSSKEEAELNGVLEDKFNFVRDSVTELYEILDVIKNLDIQEYKFNDALIESCDTKLSKLAEYYNILCDENILPADTLYYIDLSFELIETEPGLLSEFESLIEATILENTIVKYKDVLNSLYGDVDINDIASSKANGHINNLLTSTLNEVNNNSEYFSNLVELSKTITYYREAILPNYLSNTYTVVLHNFNENIPLLNGTDGSIEGELPSSNVVEKLIADGYMGNIDTDLLDPVHYPIDVVLDANYGITVKKAIINLVSQIRRDFIGILDTKCQGNPEQSINYRKSNLGVTDYRLSIFTQDFILNDDMYTNQKIQVTPTYYLASKIPENDNTYGIQWNFVGPRRGIISGFKSLSYVPNPEWKERLYKAQVNYIESDTISTRFMSQSTAQQVISAMSNINNVRSVLRIQRDVENLMKDYLFEWNDNRTIQAAQNALNGYLTSWQSNRACDSISGTVYASEYDRQQKILRVRIEIDFNNIIERVLIDINVNG